MVPMSDKWWVLQTVAVKVVCADVMMALYTAYVMAVLMAVESADSMAVEKVVM